MLKVSYTGRAVIVKYWTFNLKELNLIPTEILSIVLNDQLYMENDSVS